MIVTIPNYSEDSFNRWLLRKFWGKDGERYLVSTHNIELMNRMNFLQCIESLENVDVEMLDYLGPINLLMVLGTGTGIVRYLMYALNIIVGYLTFFLRSRTFSSDLVLVARKKK